MSFFERMPNELLNYIFSFLSVPDKGRAATVCKRWYQVLDCDEHWKDGIAIVGRYDKKIKDRLIRRRITKLMLTDYFDHRMFYNQVDTIITHDEQEILDEIEKIDDFSNVKTFEIVYGYTFDTFVLTALKKMPNLEFFCVKHCTNLSWKSIHYVGEHLKHLRHLSLSGLLLFRQEMEIFLRKLSFLELRSFSLTNVYFDIDVVEILRMCKRIEYLEIDLTEHLDFIQLMKIAANNLKELRLHQTFSIQLIWIEGLLKTYAAIVDPKEYNYTTKIVLVKSNGTTRIIPIPSKGDSTLGKYFKVLVKTIY